MTINMNEDEYISQRLDDQIIWYDDKSQFNQKFYKNLRITEIACASIIPLVAGFGDLIPYSQIIVGSLGVVIAICAGLSSLSKYQENWIVYRTTAETLKHEKYLFLTKSRPYEGNDAFPEFVQRVESQISKENSQWTSYVKKENA